MNILDKTNLTPFTFLSLPSDFEISDDPQIILAPNGTGKTTLFNILIQQNSKNCEVYSYDSSCEPTYKIIDGKKKKMIINPLTKNYTIEKQKMDIEAKVLNPEEALSIAYPGLTTSKMRSTITNPKVKKVVDSNVFTLNEPLNDDEKNKLSYVLPYYNDLKKLIKNKDALKSLTQNQKLADLKAMKMVDRKLIYTCFNIEQHKDEIENNGCPLCGNKAPNVYDEILRIKKEVMDAKFEFFENFEFLKNIPDCASALEAIDSTIDGILNLSEEKILYLLMTTADSKKEEQIKESIDKYNTAKANIDTFLVERDSAYSKMSSSEPIITKTFPLIYPKSSIKFHKSDKTIEITTPRNMETYSEGEKHEMYSTIRQLAILGSDKELVIADDPLTELDVANEYKNVFRFIQLAHENGKKVIVFTCNPNFINIANEYYPALFKRYYLTSHFDEVAGTLGLKLLTMDFPPNGGKGAYISLEQCVKSIDYSQLNFQVVSLINERANLYISKSENSRKDEISQLLHYDSSKTITVNDSTSICNNQLYDLIDKFTTLPSYTSFTQLVRDRICYLAAMRVYIEKKLFDYQQERINRGLSDCFPVSNAPYLTKDKIIKADECNDSFKIKDMYGKWDRSNLMCLKTMLNDNDHPYSLILPVSYAISLGNDSLVNEIKIIKEIFS
ncbi:MAG: hypothetical protein PUF99_04425 [Bacilli bacterium]|nr:hypothetical protein [Bacilli bacterium]